MATNFIVKKYICSVHKTLMQIIVLAHQDGIKLECAECEGEE